MSKMFFDDPLIFRGPITPDPTDPVIVVPGSGQGGLDPFACSFEDWLSGFKSDINGDANIDFEDYKAWWGQNLNLPDFNQANWTRFNPTEPWPFGN